MDVARVVLGSSLKINFFSKAETSMAYNSSLLTEATLAVATETPGPNHKSWLYAYVLNV